MRRLFRRLPLFKLIAVGEVALLARKHLQKLPPADRRRLGELVRHGHRLSPAEREELRGLLSKLEPGAFAGSALDRFSPVPLPRRFTRGRR